MSSGSILKTVLVMVGAGFALPSLAATVSRLEAAANAKAALTSTSAKPAAVTGTRPGEAAASPVAPVPANDPVIPPVRPPTRS